jgi:hypothetical protein
MPKVRVLETFIIRVWERGRQVWRGQIEHVQSGEKRNFKGLEQLYEILQRGLEEAPRDFEGGGRRRAGRAKPKAQAKP